MARTRNTRPQATPPEDRRGARELSSAENADLCAGCVRCCTYISIEVDAPRSPWEYDQWIWALHHDGIEMYVESPEAWYLLVWTRCRQLNSTGRCDIHGRHPVLCREYDPRGCERRVEVAETRATFRRAEELEAWLARERPGHFRRLMAWRKDQPAAPPKADVRADRAAATALIPLATVAGEIGASRPSGATRGGTARAASLALSAPRGARRARR